MGTIVKTADVDRPIEEVWDVWSDVRILPELSASTTEVRGAPERLTAVGQTFTQVVRAVGRCFESTWEVVDIEPCDHLTIEGSVGFGVTNRITERVQALGPDRTRMELTVAYELPFGPLGRLASKLGVERLAAHEASEVMAGLQRRLARQRPAA